MLEHLADPVQILTKLSAKLNKDGKIIIEVPNANDALLTLYKSKPFSEFTYWSCHLYLFTERNLLNLAQKGGLKADYIKQIQRYSLANHLYWLSMGKPNGHKKWCFIDSNKLNRAYEAQLASLGFCDTLMACFSKA